MRLRNALAAIAAVGLLLALIAWLSEPGLWPPVLMMSAVTAALLIERRRYGAHAAPPAGAAPTAERFIDPETGRMMRVWYDTASGQRSYVEDERR